MPKGYLPSASSRTVSLPLYCGCRSPYNPSIPQNFATSNFNRLKGIVEPGMHILHFSQAPLFVRPSISLVLPHLLKIYQRRWRVGDGDRTATYHRSVWVRACAGLDTLSALLQSNAVASAASVKTHARTMGLLGSPASSKQLFWSNAIFSSHKYRLLAPEG